ncbi:hypothetical protein RJT34_00603 [Clitoria ternatea]|uniref:Uncharacterized protein n=1 Tax=Clitoria ternatea TaxID=43366 RepID=A0AAN9Q2U0_CLITE
MDFRQSRQAILRGQNVGEKCGVTEMKLDLFGPKISDVTMLCRFGLSASSFHSHHLTDNTSSDFQTQWQSRYLLKTPCRLFKTACVAHNQTLPCTAPYSLLLLHALHTYQQNLNLLFFLSRPFNFSEEPPPRSPPIATAVSAT